MRVLVTGHRGYVGPVLVAALLERGHDVVGLDAGFYRACRVEDVPPCREMTGDVRDVSSEDLRDLDAVIHLAALSNDPLGELDPELTMAVNAQATGELARKARGAGVRRFIFASSCSIYGVGEGEELTEGSPLAPLTAYARSKMVAEEALRSLAGEGFCVTSLRPGTAYGYSPMLRLDIVANNLLAWALGTGEVLLKSDGQAWRPLVHVEDMARAFTALLEAPAGAVSGRAFNLGRDDENHRVADVARAVASAVPGARVTWAPGATADPRSYHVSFKALAEAVPAAVPRIRLAAGLEDTARRVDHLDLTPGVIEGTRFQRVKHLRGLVASGELDGRLRWIGSP